MGEGGGEGGGIKGVGPIREGWCGRCRTLGAKRLVPYYIVAAGKRTLQPCGVPKNSIDARAMGGIAPGKKDLKAVARPFRGAARLFRRTESYAALRTHFVKEKTSGRARGTN